MQKGDARAGKPSVVGGADRDSGERVVIKQWRRNPSVHDSDVKEIWRQEIRQLHRVLGYPGASDRIVPLLDSGEDREAFYLVLRPGQRLPLQHVIAESPEHHWLRQPRQERNRIIIWNNLRRIAEGLNILHTQGLLHRNLDFSAIYTSGDDIAPDFQLSGFEWSIRLTASARASPLPGGAVSGYSSVHSFLQDWHAFGHLTATLLGIDSKALSRRHKDDARDVAYYLTGLERSLILSLIRSDPLSRIDGDSINAKIQDIISSLQTIVARRDDHLYLTPSLGAGSSLSNSIREASGRSIEPGNTEAQILFIRNDLRDNPQLVRAGAYAGEAIQRYLLVGTKLTYRLAAYRHIGARGRNEPTWGIAYTESCSDTKPTESDILDYKTLEGEHIEIISRGDLNSRFAALQGKTRRWDQQIDKSTEDLNEPRAIRQYRALLLVQTLEALLVASEIWPVEIVDVTDEEGRTKIRLQYRKEDEREKLSSALGLSAPALRMREVLRDDRWQFEEDWKLTDIGVLGERDHEYAEWRFEEIIETPGSNDIYVFVGSAPRPIGDQLFLRKSSYQGTDRLLNRRVKSLLALREHAELLGALDDAAGAVRPTHELPVRDESFFRLDESKQSTLSEIIAAMPLYLLQGPPGVGKTRLVRELVRRLLSEDSSARLLLSAQSHDAVDHLLSEVEKDLPALGAGAVIVRSRPQDDKRPSSSFDLPLQASQLIARVANSPLAKSLPLALRAKLDSLIATAGNTNGTLRNDPSNHRVDRSIEAMLLRGANLVFASTNARDLARLIEERAQFDWTIIEEAGKATGPELIAPLLLSHRRLMIGDHQQLPPFDADRLKSLLSEPKRVANALDVGSSLIGWVFREAGIDEIEDEAGRGEGLEAICGEAAAALMLFETLVEEHLVHETAVAPALPIARQLTYQHRMHPAIAKLVSDTFYLRSPLRTPADVTKKFLFDSPPFCFIRDARIPLSPIVFIKMPFVQSTVGKRDIERTPRYHNEEEAEAVIAVLSKLRINPEGSERPSLAVLSPYREQVKRLKNRYLEEKANRLASLEGFVFNGVGDTPVGTVDSFQGNQADLVVVSLVRNNGRSGRRGLGFLSDPRRMNVLLSRARWKLIIIGSHEFLTSRFPPQTEHSDGGLEFLRRMLGVIDELANTSSSKEVRDATLIDYAAFSGEVK